MSWPEVSHCLMQWCTLLNCLMTSHEDAVILHFALQVFAKLRHGKKRNMLNPVISNYSSVSNSCNIPFEIACKNITPSNILQLFADHTSHNTIISRHCTYADETTLFGKCCQTRHLIWRKWYAMWNKVERDDCLKICMACATRSIMTCVHRQSSL